ncbi:glycosyltransferase family 4 protein [Patescibacteria group bacterium]
MPVNTLKKQSIALVSGTYPPCECGVGRYTKRLHESLRAQGVETMIITSQFTKIRKVVQMEKIDVVHLQYPTSAYGKRVGLVCKWWMLRFFTKAKMVLTVHEYLTYSWKGRFKIWLLMVVADQIIVPDKSFVEAMVRLWLISERKISAIPVGPNLEIVRLSQEEIQAKRGAKGLQLDEIVIGFWGYLEPSKGLLTLLESLQRLRERGYRYRLSLLSALDSIQETSDKQDLINGRYRAKIKDFLKDNFEDEDILWPADYSDRTLAEELALVDLFVLPFVEGATSRRSTLISVISAGLPVVSTEAKMIDKTLDGLWLVKPDAPDDLAEAIEKIIDKPEMLDELKRRSQIASDNFSWDSIAKQHASLYTKFRQQNKQTDINSVD